MICSECSKENLLKVELCSYCQAKIQLRETRILSDLTSQEIVEIIESDLRGAYPPQGMSLAKSDGPDAIWRVTGVLDKYFNNVTCVNWDPEETSIRVKKLIEEFNTYGVDYTWWISPTSSLVDLPKLLEKHGMFYQEDFPGMAVDLLNLKYEYAQVTDLKGFKIFRVDNKVQLNDFVNAYIIATNSNPKMQSGLVSLFTKSGYKKNNDWSLYSATLNGKTVSTTALFTGAGVAGIYLVSTIPSARRRNIATKIVVHALKQARDHGYTIGTLQASEEGLGLYLKLGFRKYCSFPLYTKYHIS
ncbi:MAG: GNAT family N-acetyltransferase [SAR202 cluster bacterium]|nr:GNAT family N-acetyltransferase [SAR202 cluster bacterium]|tara:strand:+ start:1415 stop:2317 length:903 start_codon:yes stop_codon:yes gene_type:complete